MASAGGDSVAAGAVPVAGVWVGGTAKVSVGRGAVVEIVVVAAAGSGDGLSAISGGAAICAGPAAAAVRPAVASATSRASSKPQRREPGRNRTHHQIETIFYNI